MMMQLNFPAVQVGFFKAMFPFITFDLVPEFITNFVYDNVFSLKNVNYYTEEADILGYGSLFLVINSGSVGILFAITVIQQITASILTRITRKGSRVNRFAEAEKRSFRWAGFTNLLNATYLNMAFAVAINGSVFDFSTPETAS